MSFIQAQTLVNFLGSDGQAFADLVLKWARSYLPRCGASPETWSINNAVYLKDGGCDGLIASPNFVDPVGFIHPNSVIQLKVGNSTASEILKELGKKPPQNRKRIRDELISGKKLVWFVGRAFADLDLVAKEKELAQIVHSINPQAPHPSIIDATRFCQYLAKTPAVAAGLVSTGLHLVTSDMALKDVPHNLFRRFVEGENFPEFKQSIGEFLSGSDQDQRIMYIAGEPGIGKSRSVLEAVEGDPAFAGTALYFKDPSQLQSFFAFATQQQSCGICIVDDYIGESARSVLISENSLPPHLKAILIGHSPEINSATARGEHRMKPLTNTEQSEAMRLAFPGLKAFQIELAIQLGRGNLRLARSACKYLERNPGITLEKGLEEVVDFELTKLPNAHAYIACLALLPFLKSEDIARFCTLCGFDEAEFRRACQEVNQTSGLIQTRDHTTYVGAREIGQVALQKLWRTRKEYLSQILIKADQFTEDIVIALKDMYPCSERDEMLSFFSFPVAQLSLSDLIDPVRAGRILALLLAEPEKYLPAIARAIRESEGVLDQYPYDSGRYGRRDLIWKLRDLAQFEEHFPACEDIVYRLAREEVPSGYSNRATTYWAEWFRPYFDYTEYPLTRRYELLERRIEGGDMADMVLVLHALSAQFPDHGSNIPSDRVGGRFVPQETRAIRSGKIQTAVEKVPAIFAKLLASPDEDFRDSVSEAVVKSCFSWLEHGALDAYIKIVQSPGMRARSVADLIAKARHYVALERSMGEPPNPRVKWLFEQHQLLLAALDSDDPMLDVLEVANGRHYHRSADQKREEKLKRISELFEHEPLFRKEVIEILVDPKVPGGTDLGRTLGPTLTHEEVEDILRTSEKVGFSSFSSAAVQAYGEASQAASRHLERAAQNFEGLNLHLALQIYRILGDERYFQEGARLLNDWENPTEFFGGLWFSELDRVKPYHWAYIEQLARRMNDGDEGAALKCLEISVRFADLRSSDLRAHELGLNALERCGGGYGDPGGYEWSEVGECLLQSYPEQVIEIAASKEQSELSYATKVLASGAKLYPDLVINQLTNILTTELHYIFAGALTDVLAVLDEAKFDRWLRSQAVEVVVRASGHLPKPFLDENGTAAIPTITRRFWEYCDPSYPGYEDALGYFLSHTFNTGVYGGFGVGLFSDRVILAKQVQNDTNPGLREWAQKHLSSSLKNLEDANRRQDIHQARLDTDIS